MSTEGVGYHFTPPALRAGPPFTPRSRMFLRGSLAAPASLPDTPGVVARASLAPISACKAWGLGAGLGGPRLPLSEIHPHVHS